MLLYFRNSFYSITMIYIFMINVQIDFLFFHPLMLTLSKTMLPQKTVSIWLHHSKLYVLYVYFIYVVYRTNASTQTNPIAFPYRVRICNSIILLSGSISKFKEIQWASHCFPIKKSGRQDYIHMIARPSIKKDIENLKTMRGIWYMPIKNVSEPDQEFNLISL